MVRSRKTKVIDFEPNVTYFKPRGVLLVDLKEVDLTLDELETLRLANIKKFSQADSAKKMNIHQSTFQRTLARAREKVTDALVHGKAIKIHGGDYSLTGKNKPLSPCLRKETVMETATTKCICPECGYEEFYTRGKPCGQIKCNDCGKFMIRK